MNKKNTIDDGFRADLVEEATFCGILEIPEIKAPAEIHIPLGLIPFTQRKKSINHDEYVMFYEHDIKFADVLLSTDKYIEELSAFPGLISPDCSLYRDMPLAVQIANIYMSRAVGSYFQSRGFDVIPNVRWGDERTYTTCMFQEKIAFVGLPKHSIVSIGTYGCIRGKENAYHFREGLRAMIEELEPEVVLVYGAMPDSLFSEFINKTKFIQYPDWISTKRRES